MKAKILNINGGEAYNIKIGDIVELELLKPPYNLVGKYTTKGLCGNRNWKPIFQEEDVDILLDNQE